MLAYVGFNGYQTSTMNFQTFSQVAFAFRVTPRLLAQGLIYALAMGLIGGLFAGDPRGAAADSDGAPRAVALRGHRQSGNGKEIGNGQLPDLPTPITDCHSITNCRCLCHYPIPRLPDCRLARTVNNSSMSGCWGMSYLLAQAIFPAFVDDENRAFRDAVFAKHAVERRDPSVRMEIAQQRKRNPAERIGPGFLRRTGIDADAQNFGVELVEARVLFLVRLHLDGADGRERERMEREHDVLLSSKARQPNGLTRLV